MSREFDVIKGNVLAQREAVRITSEEQEIKARESHTLLEERCRAERTEIAARNEADKRILVESGVMSLFEEIKNSGLLKNNTKTEDVYRKVSLFGGEKLFSEHVPGSTYVEEKLIEQLPSIEINADDYNSNRVCVKLMFGGSIRRNVIGLYGLSSYKYIEVAVRDGTLNILKGKIGDNGYFEEYVPIGEGELVSVITEAIQNPIPAKEGAGGICGDH